MPSKKGEPADERPVFDSIRKPTAPPTRIFGSGRPSGKMRPAARKTKHKKKLEVAD